MSNVVRITTSQLTFPIFELRTAADLANGLTFPVAAFVFEEPSKNFGDCCGFLVTGAIFARLLDRPLRDNKRVAAAQLLKRSDITKNGVLIFIPKSAGTVEQPTHLMPQRMMSELEGFPSELWGRHHPAGTD